MELKMYRLEDRLEEVLELRISSDDMQSLQLDAFDQRLLEECGASDKASDKLLAAEMIVRRLEQQTEKSQSKV